MARLLGLVLPLALGAAISPTVLGLELVALSRKQDPLKRAWALAAGCATVLALFTAIALGVARSTGGSSSPSDAGAIVKLVAAVLLLALGVRQMRAPPRPPKPEHEGSHPLRRSAALGAGVMLANFSSIVLFFPAMHEIGISGISLTGKVLAGALVYLITLLPAFGPPLAVTLLGDRATPLLERLNRFFALHRRGIGAGICFAFAVLLGVAGLKALL